MSAFVVWRIAFFYCFHFWLHIQTQHRTLALQFLSALHFRCYDRLVSFTRTSTRCTLELTAPSPEMGDLSSIPCLLLLPPLHRLLLQRHRHLHLLVPPPLLRWRRHHFVRRHHCHLLLPPPARLLLIVRRRRLLVALRQSTPLPLHLTASFPHLLRYNAAHLFSVS